ncbi:uncharacterized protein LOC135485115 [Lineus longissimus]|uniref:uncharacterized protein LOC135485115 n=1 Tax=Lineus longissimus TaxID=88925 RepID=UPI00315C7EC8
MFAKVLQMNCCRSSPGRNLLLFILFIFCIIIAVVYVFLIGPVVSALKSLPGLRDLSNLDSFTNFISKQESIRELVHSGQDGGIASWHDQLLGRLYMVSHKAKSRSNPAHPDQAAPGPDTLSFFGVDVSHSLEATYIYRRILQRDDFHVPKLIVDIGANDGLLSSNSFNFIHWGWSAILVEPQQKMLDMAKKNTEMFRDPYNDGKQIVEYVPAVIGETDGKVQMAVANDIVNMENYVVTNHRKAKSSHTIEVPSMTVQTFAKNLNVPQKFGILSIDAEGVGDKILHQFIEAGFRPEYVIYEPLHNSEYHLTTIEYMKKAGYKFLTKRGWNQIYELRTPLE